MLALAVQFARVTPQLLKQILARHKLKRENCIVFDVWPKWPSNILLRWVSQLKTVTFGKSMKSEALALPLVGKNVTCGSLYKGRTLFFRWHFLSVRHSAPYSSFFNKSKRLTHSQQGSSIFLLGICSKMGCCAIPTNCWSVFMQVVTRATGRKFPVKERVGFF